MLEKFKKFFVTSKYKVGEEPAMKDNPKIKKSLEEMQGIEIRTVSMMDNMSSAKQKFLKYMITKGIKIFNRCFKKEIKQPIRNQDVKILIAAANQVSDDYFIEWKKHKVHDLKTKRKLIYTGIKSFGLLLDGDSAWRNYVLSMIERYNQIQKAVKNG